MRVESRYLIEPGAKIGKWTAIFKFKQKKEWQWLVKCECGAESYVKQDSLRRGIKTGPNGNGSTMCRSCAQFFKSTKRPKGESGARGLRQIYMARARERGLCFELSIENFMAITKENCHYCNKEPGQKTFYKGSARTIEWAQWIYNGIDRKDPSVGYTLSNCLPCCSVCNYAKLDTPYNDFLSWVEKVSNNIKAISALAK